MGLLDRFRTAAPPATQPAGRSGRTHYQGYLQLEELNVDLQGLRGLRTFDRMFRTDPDVRRSLAMVCNPIAGATWTVEPYGGEHATDLDRRIADDVHWALMEHMAPNLHGHLAEALPLFTRSGFCPFEQIWEPADRDGRRLMVPRKLDVRLPRSIIRWPQDDYGDLEGIEQFVPGHGGFTFIDAGQLVYYRVGAEGDNWEGTSLLRPAYKPWLLKDKIERLDAIAQEREATGIPVLYPPTADVDEDVLSDLERTLAGLKGGEEAAVTMPGPHAGDVDAGQGWRLDIVGMGAGSSVGGGSRDAQPSLKYHSDKIAAAVIAEFIRLGQTNVGARATADVQQEPFYAGVEALAGVVESELNGQLIPRIVALNWPGANGAPTLSMELADSTSLTELKDFVAGLVQQGVLVPDHPLEDFLRDRGDLPPADAQARKAHDDRAATVPTPPGQPTGSGGPGQAPPGDGKPGQPPPEGDPGQPQPPAGRPLGADAQTHARQDRELKAHEQHMSLDQIEAAIDGARDRFAQAAGPTVLALAQHAAGQALAGKAVKLDAGTLQQTLSDELAGLYALGRQSVADELARQGAGEQTYGFAASDLPGRVGKAARLAAQAIATRVAQAVGRLALNGRATPAGMQVAAETEGQAALRAEALAHAAGALNDGRAAEADARSNEIAGTYYTSILDGNRCAACARADDDVLRPLDDPVRLARRPPNPDCAGGDRCRCMEAYVLRDEQPPPGVPVSA